MKDSWSVKRSMGLLHPMFYYGTGTPQTIRSRKRETYQRGQRTDIGVITREKETLVP